jgi:hypothetical protein
LSATRSSDRLNQTNDVRAVGVQSFPANATATEQLIVFAVNNYGAWSSPSSNEFDIYIDVDGDGKPDYIVVGLDLGALQTGTFRGRMASAVFSTKSDGADIQFFATARSDSATALLPILSSQLCRDGEPCLSADKPRFSYEIVSFDLLNGGTKVVSGSAKFNAWSSSISQGDFVTVAPGGTGTSPVTVNSGEAKMTPALGLMVVTLDNKNGAEEAQLISVTK